VKNYKTSPPEGQEDWEWVEYPAWARSRREPFVPIPDAMLPRSTVRDAAFFAWSCLAWFVTDRRREVRVFPDELGSALGLGRRQIRRAVAELQKRGLLQRVGGGHSQWVRLYVPSGEPVADFKRSLRGRKWRKTPPSLLRDPLMELHERRLLLLILRDVALHRTLDPKRCARLLNIEVDYCRQLINGLAEKGYLEIHHRTPGRWRVIVLFRRPRLGLSLSGRVQPGLSSEGRLYLEGRWGGDPAGAGPLSITLSGPALKAFEAAAVKKVEGPQEIEALGWRLYSDVRGHFSASGRLVLTTPAGEFVVIRPPDPARRQKAEQDGKIALCWGQISLPRGEVPIECEQNEWDETNGFVGALVGGEAR